MGKGKSSRSGFTRADLLVLLGCICFLALVWIRPSLAGVAARNDEAVCANNLRQIGQAFAQWTQQHDERYAWWMTPAEGGNKGMAFSANAWFQFFAVSNELRSPRVLADPADDWLNLRVATSWGSESGGLVNPFWRNDAISYFLGIHATPLLPQSVVSGDRNAYGFSSPACSSGMNTLTEVNPQNGFWTANVHGQRGNLLFNDGRVEMTDTARLKEAVGSYNKWNIHYLKPRQ